ncbi:hypothetical protein LXA43DRAFT_1094091 [Ganoderma leucocontextum]|nr:hypothetical protein LXA43DRAFT_1094091 [Ganoderma leucocontextum]
MPFIPIPTLFGPDSNVTDGPTRCTFNMTLPSADTIPEIPSFPEVIAFVRALWSQGPSACVSLHPELRLRPLCHFAQFAEDHPDALKIGWIIVLVVLVLIVAWFVLPALLSVFSAVGTGIYYIVHAIVTGALAGVVFILRIITQLFVSLAAGVLWLVGFTVNGVAAGSIAACLQSVVYGPLTTGVFSALQSLGVILGRLAFAICH